MNQIDVLMTARDIWSIMDQIVDAPPENILILIREKFTQADAEQRRRLIWLVGRLKAKGAEQVLLDWLHAESAENAADLLRAINNREAVVAFDDLVLLLNAHDHDPIVLKEVITSAGLSGHASLADIIAPKLDDPDLKIYAAVALGRLGATAYTHEILSRLPSLKGAVHDGFAVSLELMNDASAIEPLRQWLMKAPTELRLSVHNALVRLTGREPLLPLKPPDWWDTEDTTIRDAWAGFDKAVVPKPRVEQFELRDAAEAHFILCETSGAIRIDYGLSWPRWDRSLFIGGQRIYNVGSTCGTCEMTLRLAGWSEESAAMRAQQVRTALKDVPTISWHLFDALDPLLKEMRPGHYIAALVDLDLEQVSDPGQSWWFRRRLDRRDDEDEEDTEVKVDPQDDWPGTDHFQLKSLTASKEPAFCSILPSQDLSGLKSSVVAEYEDNIRRGQRPAFVALSWFQSSYAQGEYEERFLLGVVLDGHHKLAAYAKQNVPARALLICRLEDTWGPKDDRARDFLEAISSMKVSAGFSKD